MELYYNPERMSEAEVRETFVANQWLVDEILSILEQQPKGAGVQHALIIAPRGMGKTTVLLMLRFSILGSDLAQSWQPVLFPEESYAVYDLADLWLSALNHLATETHDAELTERVSELQRTHRDSRELGEAALATIKDWRTQNNKQVLMLVDSVDIILDQIGDERDHAELRDVLMNDGTMMLVGGATTFFKEAREYDQPLYNLFKTYDLSSLNSDQIHDLLRRRARVDELENFDEQLKRNASRLRVLEYFTGGNPRLVMMLYRVITRSEVSEVRRGLEKLLDEVTPYYKAKIESLPAQQRKILDHIARISARTREGLTPTEIAASVRLGVNQVSAQLKRLADIGYVRAANIRGRSSYYTLSEPLYAIWHQMRFGREARERMNWLVTFLKGWYDAEEINTECARLQNTFDEYLAAGRLTEARDVLEYRRYLVGALESDSERARINESIILSYLELEDVATLKRQILMDINTAHLTRETQLRLSSAGLLTPETMKSRITDRSEQDDRIADSDSKIEAGQAALQNGDVEEALKNFHAALELTPDSMAAISGVALIQLDMDDRSAALQTLENGIECSLDSSSRTILTAFRCAVERDFDRATTYLNKLESDSAFRGWAVVGTVLKMNSRLEEALIAFRRANEFNAANSEIWFEQAETLIELKRYQEAIESIDRGLAAAPDSAEAHKMRGLALEELGKHRDAVSSFDRALDLDPELTEAWMLRSVVLVQLDKKEESLISVEKACELEPKNYGALLTRAWTLWKLGRNKQLLKAADAVLNVNPNSFDAHYLRGISLAALGRHKASVKALEHAFKNPVDHSLMWDSGAASVKFLLSLSVGDLTTATEDWRAMETAAQTEGGNALWVNVASLGLRQAALLGDWKFVRELITTSELEEQLFPLARALDYLLTSDEMLIEKLSPEIRKIVEEIVHVLKSSSPKSNPNKKKTLKRGKS